MEKKVSNERELRAFGVKLGASLVGGEVIELVGDVGAGKTTLVKAIASGIGVTDDVGSPSYTLGQVYEGPRGIRLAHYDFYRLNDPGILANELEEALADERTVTAIEWGDIVTNVLPADHLQIYIVPLGDTERQLTIKSGGEKSHQAIERFKW